jgi:hypothetical protein
MARGLPAASASTRAPTCGSSPGAASLRSARAAAPSSGSRWSWFIPRVSTAGEPSRTASTIATPSEPSRRAANSSAVADALSSHCASSTRQSSGRSPSGSSTVSASRLPRCRRCARRCARCLRSAEGPFKGEGLRARNPVQPPERRPQQQVQSGERKLRLGLDRGRAQQRHAPRRARRDVEQGRLPGAGLAADHQRAAVARPGAAEQRQDGAHLAVTPAQRGCHGPLSSPIPGSRPVPETATPARMSAPPPIMTRLTRSPRNTAAPATLTTGSR